METTEVEALQKKVGDLQKQLDVLDRDYTKMMTKRNEVMLKHRSAKRELAVAKAEAAKEPVTA